MRFDSPAADTITATVFFILGASMSYGGFVMDRLEIRQIHPASIPGLVPMILGVALMICAVLLALGARNKAVEEGGAEEAASWFSFLIAAGMSCFYALVLVGWLPFAVATGIYMAAFSGWFLWVDGDRARPMWTLILVAIFAIVMSTAIATLFRDGFLVRLP